MRSEVLLLAGLMLCAGAAAAQAGGERAAVSIIIDDMGYRLEDGRRAVGLPGALAFAILPHSPHGERLARLAAARGKEVLVHLPMEAGPGANPGPGALTSDMDRARFVRTLKDNLARVPHAVGVNNHMGSVLTRHRRAMGWLMETLHAHGRLLFVDSRTTALTVAEDTARALHVPSLRRDVFLDGRADRAHVRVQLDRLIARAHRTGTAIAIAHPLPETLDVLAAALPTLRYRGVRLVSLAEMIALKGEPSWQLSLYHSRRDARNSKPSP